MLTPAIQLAQDLAPLARKKIAGAISFFGEEFSPDAFPSLVAAVATEHELVLHFGEAERLFVTDPQDAVVSRRDFVIRSARIVRWEWFSYGAPLRPENLHVVEYTRHADRQVTVVDTSDWYEPEHAPDVSAPAVAFAGAAYQ